MLKLHRLMAARRRVDNRQPPMPQADQLIAVKSRIIRPAMTDGVGHLPDLLRVIPVKSGDPAHQLVPLAVQFR